MNKTADKIKQFQNPATFPFFDYNKIAQKTKIPSGYLFRDGRIIDFEKITLNNINFQSETGALRIRTTPNEINVDFIAEIKPSKEQLDTIKKLKLPSRRLFFEMVDKNNNVLKGYGGFNKTIFEMEQQLLNFYNKNMFTKAFKQLSKRDVKIAGGKGASLGELMRLGVSVPPGFVILASAFEKFLEETDINVEIDAMWDRLNVKDAENIEENSEIVRDIILKKKFPKDLGREILAAFDKLGAKYVAVRSSATAEDSKIDAWAGQLESYLYVIRKNLLESVQKCWASLYTPRALFYRAERKLQRKPVLVAVVIQKMVNSEVSGVCFTTHPVTKDKDQMIIEACWGLGEVLVQGIITPDSYVIEKSALKLVDVNVNPQEKQIVKRGEGTGVSAVPKIKKQKQKLSGKQIIELAKICKRIEQHYKKPQDIEWAVEKDKFYIVQSRPITTLQK